MEPADRQPFYDLKSPYDYSIRIRRLMVAYSRHMNLGSNLSIRRIDHLRCPPVSSFNLQDAAEDATTIGQQLT
jgi:hypothetical protein